jgi:predicted acylesterase/phospholipase RssA
LFHSGLVDTKPLHKFLDDFFEAHGGEIKRKVVALTVDTNSGSTIQFNETEPDFVKAIMSSAAIPFMFPNIQYPEQGYVNMDGGVAYGVNLASAVQRCREVIDDDSKITIDIIMCGSNTTDPAPWTDRNNAYSNFLRFKEIKSHNEDIADIYEFIQAYPKVNFRYFVAPTK